MKKHAIIPIFIPHLGCPNDCVFCNQKKITARQHETEVIKIIESIEKYLSTLRDRGLSTIEIAFYGGSFTGLSMDEQNKYLKIALDYKKRGQIDKIHLSTRPDYISPEILDNLKAHGVDIIELGVQSFDDEVLRLSERGHDSRVVRDSAELIRDYGFELGIQLMIGLPGDSMNKCLESAKEAVKLRPRIARLYPTIVIEDTKLMELYRGGQYTPLTTERAVTITKEMYKILEDAGINIIRVGLKSSDLIHEGGEIAGGTFHPAFRQLVEGEIARERLVAQLYRYSKINACNAIDISIGTTNETITFASNPRCFSNMIGNGKRNKRYFECTFPDCKITYKVDPSLADGEYLVIK